MSQTRPPLAWLLWVVIAIACSTRVARAQDDDEPEAIAPPPPRAQFTITEDTVNQWLFGNTAGPQAARARLESLLTATVIELDRACALTEAQRTKLRLAGRGDLTRLFDRVEDAKQQFTLIENDRNRLRAVVLQFSPLRDTLSGDPFGPGSVFEKALRTTLSEEKRSKRPQNRQQRTVIRLFVNLVHDTVENEGVVLRLTPEQKARFVTVLLEETLPRDNASQDEFRVLIQAAKLPEATLRPIFSPLQWEAFKRRLERAKVSEQDTRELKERDELIRMRRKRLLIDGAIAPRVQDAPR